MQFTDKFIKEIKKVRQINKGAHKNSALLDSLSNHPCFSPSACYNYSRIHLPVAPKCNIQCNYCNRRFDCHNECRPGVTSHIVKPREALKLVEKAVEKMPHLKVVGVAGPGDPLANDETFETFRLIKDSFPSLTLCLSTNGLLLSERKAEILGLEVRFVTVTVNAVDPEVGERIYSWVLQGKELFKGREAAKLLIDKQQQGIKELIEKGVIVKVNTVVCPTINEHHIPKVAERMQQLGVHVMNIVPLIPVEGTPFSHLNAPDVKILDRLRDNCAAFVRQVRHCRQCRSDAVGFLSCSDTISEPVWGALKIAVATSNGLDVDKEFGTADTFWIYKATSTRYELIDKRKVRQYCFGKINNAQSTSAIEELLDCQAVICLTIGHKPRQELLIRGVEPLEFSGSIQDAISRLVIQKFRLRREVRTTMEFKLISKNKNFNQHSTFR